jgi:Cu-Zn family superoxide dismutase
MKNTAHAIGIALMVTSFAAAADAVTVTMNKIDDKGVGAAIGTVALSDGPNGLVIKPNLKGLRPGEHGFHVHENANCGAKEKDGKMVAGLAAGGHYDPTKTGKHEGPKGHGHLGDLPALMVTPDGMARGEMTASRLKVADLKGRSLMIHEGGDNYSDQPKPLGGGGGRVACGVIK